MRPPGWRARLVLIGLVTAAMLVAAWVYLPDFREGLVIVWGDTKAAVIARLK